MKIPKLETRTFTTALLDLAERGVISWEAIAREALEEMPEDDVEWMGRTAFGLETEDDDE